MDLKQIIAVYTSERYKYYKPTTPENIVIQKWLVFDSHDDYFDKYLGFYKKLSDFTELIVHAVDGTFEVSNNGISHFIKHNHQKRYTKDGHQIGVSPDALKKVRNNLLKKTDYLKEVNSFDEIFAIVSSAKEIGFGQLAIYDTTVRIGAYLNIEPNKVFLHAGAQIGMRYLEQKGYVKPGISESLFVDIQHVPLELQEVRPIVIEHFLCSQKDKLESFLQNKLLK
ncbi:hypothetical protein HDE68_003187 [Pedobacter cryoconitis]|uniref:Uncharacterized protein n=1 Tax=Pedobacter cryoconitis TaxID=188932 RepID=A0A7W8ZNF7_9SPHI|nr:hypothetical protein [Pedobacter cryoconitis]MBB5637274.1 hypothetical protein [Pedobacter cryoconitis]